MVLSAIVVMTTMAVQFAYDTNVAYHLANNEKDRLKAYYLAKSAYSFMLIELKFDRTFRKVVADQNLGQYLGGNAQLPLCQQFPMSTGLIRAVFTGGGLEALTGGGEKGAGEEAANAESEDIEEKQKDASISDENMAKEFLGFEGDFDGECVSEDTKINLNGFADLAVASQAEGQASAFDQYKQFLIKFLSRTEFELLFEKAGVKVNDVVGNIGDWIDTNTEVSDVSGRGGGIEKALYERAGARYPVKNGRLTTLLEAYLIDGVVDDWFGPLMDDFTIYGDGKINVCTASQDVVEGLIRRYVDSNPNLPPLRLEDPEEMGKLLKSILDVCATGVTGDQLKTQVASALNTAIGAVSTKQPTQTPQESTGGGAVQPAGFEQYIETQQRYFSLKLTGQVADTTVRIKTVLDVKEQDPKKWKMLYWRVY